MKRFAKITAFLLLCFNLLTFNASAKELVAVGQAVGLELRDGTVTVAAFDEKLGAAARDSGLEAGDIIVSIDGRSIRSAEDVRAALTTSKGTVAICARRDGEEFTCKITPEITFDGPKLGLYLRQGVTGVGTVTWYDPQTGAFGTLGHGVNNSSGQLLKLVEGSAYETDIAAVRKGTAGTPGQLMGCTGSRKPIGTLTANTAKGVFGTTQIPWDGEVLETAAWNEIRTGEATILSTISGNLVQEYSVDILKIYPKSKQAGRNLLIKITDPALLEATGGIVQGMSGSPIIQDGKLVGAVTHVLVNDPTTGYGIFIENMLDAAS